MHVCCRHLSKRFGPIAAVCDLSLEVGSGECIVLVGSIGAGKTTLLRLLAGFETPDEGQVEFDGRVLSRPSAVAPPAERSIGMVFQQSALWNHLTVVEHLRLVANARRHVRVSECEIEETLRRFGLSDLAHRYPEGLSGGQSQQLALALALSRRPRLLLLDEPARHLDREAAERVHALYREHRAAAGVTSVYVSHDPAEVPDPTRFVVLEGGCIVQTGTPEDVHARPVSLSVARLLGPADGISGQRVDAHMAQTPFGPMQIDCDGGGRDLLVISRPEAWCRDPNGAVAVKVDTSQFERGKYLIGGEAGGQALHFHSDRPLPRGSMVRIHQTSSVWSIPA